MFIQFINRFHSVEIKQLSDGAVRWRGLKRPCLKALQMVTCSTLKTSFERDFSFRPCKCQLSCLSSSVYPLIRSLQNDVLKCLSASSYALVVED